VDRDSRVITDHLLLGCVVPELGEQPELSEEPGLGECLIRYSAVQQRSCICRSLFFFSSSFLLFAPAVTSFPAASISISIKTINPNIRLLLGHYG